jgi:hypothetical protein
MPAHSTCPTSRPFCNLPRSHLSMSELAIYHPSRFRPTANFLVAYNSGATRCSLKNFVDIRNLSG